jgi:cytidine deaminase
VNPQHLRNYPQEQELVPSPSDEDLIQRAREAQQHAYAPYSQFRVGAALLTTDAKVYTGCNVENASFGATNCAERTAVFCAICDGSRHFTKIVIVADSDEPVMPCGICRTVLSEFAPDLEIIAVGASGKIERTKLASLYPQGFRLKKQ